MLASRAFILITACAFAAEGNKPPCTEGRLGQFWPIEANFQSEVRWQSARQGTLEICTQAGLRKVWKPVKMNRPRIAAEPPQKNKSESYWAKQ